MHHTDFAHEFLRGDPMVRIELICHVRLGYRPNKASIKYHQITQYMRRQDKTLKYFYLFSGSEGVFIWHILNVIGQRIIGQNIFVLIDAKHGIFEGQLCWRLFLVR